MNKLKTCIPLSFISGNRAKKVSLFQRVSAFFFGSPNVRRANGIIYSGFDIFGTLKSLMSKLRKKKSVLPIFEIDRIGTIYNEKLPRIWLSEELFNTKHDGDGRIFVECYPKGPDIGGHVALELGDRYLCEGYRMAKNNEAEKSTECFQAAEILYMHSIRRGNRQAASRLHEMYTKDLCKGKWYESYLTLYAKHALKPSSKFTSRYKLCAQNASS